MFAKLFPLVLAALFAASSSPAAAIPLFAQRYGLTCGACHSALPELNPFGEHFRNHGYRLPGAARHGTTGVAVRYQLQYDREPAAGTRRFTPGAALLSNADLGAVSAFVHYNLGAGGGPSALYLAYLTTYNAHTRATYRAGYFELPLSHSAGQRLDTLAPAGFDAARVGLNDVALNAPRLGVEAEREVGAARFGATVAFGEYKGTAYGGKPVPTGETSSASTPEFGLYARAAFANFIDVGAEALSGTRRIAQIGRPPFADAYRRDGMFVRFHRSRFEALAEQWWGRDANADGFGTAFASSGGFVRFKYYPRPHAYVGARYDAVANPFVTRDLTLYAAAHVTPHARLLLERRQPLGGAGKGTFEGAVTVGFPWPPKL